VDKISEDGEVKWPINSLILLLLLLGGAQEARAYSYGPACQWIHLRGEIQAPPQALRPIELTLSYRLPHMGEPATLLTNWPLKQDRFVFYLSGFSEELEGVHFVSPMFFFAKEIVFNFYAKSADGKWRSELMQSTWKPPHIPILDIPKNEGKDYRCHSGIDLGRLPLKHRPPSGRRRVFMGWP
jgi:hypothetical protein